MGKADELLEILKDYHNTEDTAIKCRELCELFNLTAREVRIVVNNLRVEGNPICTSNSGSWYSTKTEDIMATIHKFNSQVFNMDKVVKGLWQAINGSTGGY